MKSLLPHCWKTNWNPSRCSYSASWQTNSKRDETQPPSPDGEKQIRWNHEACCVDRTCQSGPPSLQWDNSQRSLGAPLPKTSRLNISQWHTAPSVHTYWRCDYSHLWKHWRPLLPSLALTFETRRPSAFVRQHKLNQSKAAALHRHCSKETKWELERLLYARKIVPFMQRLSQIIIILRKPSPRWSRRGRRDVYLRNGHSDPVAES